MSRRWRIAPPPGAAIRPARRSRRSDRRPRRSDELARPTLHRRDAVGRVRRPTRRERRPHGLRTPPPRWRWRESSASTSRPRLQHWSVPRSQPGGCRCRRRWMAASLINDAYNANPASMAAALEALAAIDAERRVAVLGLMAELADPVAEHRAIARLPEQLGVELVAVETAHYGTRADRPRRRARRGRPDRLRNGRARQGQPGCRTRPGSRRAGRLALLARGCEPAAVEPVLLLVVANAASRRQLVDELGRYRRDYRIETAADGERAIVRLRALRSTGVPVGDGSGRSRRAARGWRRRARPRPRRGTDGQAHPAPRLGTARRAASRRSPHGRPRRGSSTPCSPSPRARAMRSSMARSPRSSVSGRGRRRRPWRPSG